jgi:hypothetical protein
VTVDERVAKLGALLARVTERARAPRGPNGAGTSQSDTSAADVDDLLSASSQDGGAVALTVDEPFSPPPAEVEIVAEVTVDDEEAYDGPEAADTTLREVRDELPSRERMVAASPAVPVEARRPAADEETKEIELPAVETGERPTASRAAEPQLEPDTEVPPEVILSEPQEAAEPEEAVEPPASSRRPIALEPKLEELAFGDAAPSEQPHAPPPESGRQVASPPVELDFEAEFTGVRPRDAEPAAPSPPFTAVARPMDVSAPEVTTGQRKAGPAAVFEGAAPVFKPSTFGDLLDATLSL